MPRRAGRRCVPPRPVGRRARPCRGPRPPASIALNALAVSTDRNGCPGGRDGTRELPHQLSFSAREMGHARLQAPTLRGAS